MALNEPQKEATILNQSEAILKVVADLQAILDNRFNRTPADAAKGEGKPTAPNVLDEIMENLERGRGWLHEIVSFVSSNVLPKIN